MRISDWSSDVCSSDLLRSAFHGGGARCRSGMARLLPPQGAMHDQHKSRRATSRPLSFFLSRQVATRTRGAATLSDRRLNRGVGHHRSEEHTSELQSLMRISYAVFCLKKKNNLTHI